MIKRLQTQKYAGLPLSAVDQNTDEVEFYSANILRPLGIELADCIS
ncbi:hypothetical protein [uncultured Psychromonas sp.]|nr:hypothetical protein [uncultured Psychromonas sp.]